MRIFFERIKAEIKMAVGLCRCVGYDMLGNAYYQSRDGRRWVVYKGTLEPSKVPPLWHAWLHKTTDRVPQDEGLRYAWQKAHVPNLNGTKYGYKAAGPSFKRAYIPWTPHDN